MTAEGAPPRTRPRWPLVVAVLALVAVVVTALALSTPSDSDRGPAAAAPTETETAAAPATPPTSPPATSPTPAATPTGSPTAAPTRTAAPPASARPTAQPSRSRSADSAAPTPPAGSEADQASTRPPVPLDEPEGIERGLTARVSRLESVPGEASGPGEIAGPALRASVTLSNESRRSIDLTSTVVNLYYGPDETPASVLSGPDAAALPDRVPAGEAATGRFVFSVPPEGRDEVLITVDYSVTTPVVAFRGAAPR